MPEFNRFDILKRFVRLAQNVDVVQKDGIEIRRASYGKHLVTARKNLETGALISVKLDDTEAVGTPNPLNDQLAEEIYDWIEFRRKELERIGNISMATGTVKNSTKTESSENIAPIDRDRSDR